MRPIKLSMSAFGPYTKPVELDFEKGLNGQNFFLIHGATGAGKTSILDAICFALYGKSSGGERSDKMLRSDMAADETKTEVDFTFSFGKKIYRIYRGLAQGKAKRAAELYVEGELLTANAKEVDEHIKNLTGFEVGQFRQVVMLPQGNFRKFLLANSKDRGEVLNVIFDADFYETIERGLKDRAQKSKADLDELSTRQKNYLDEAREIFGAQEETFDEKNLELAIQDAAANLEKSKAERDELQQKVNDATKKLSDGKIFQEQFEIFEASLKNLQAAKDELERVTKNLDAAQVEYDRRKGEEPTRRELENKITELKKIKASLDEFRSKRAELIELEHKEYSARQNVQRLQQEYKVHLDLLDSLREQEEDLRGADLKFQTAGQNLKSAQDFEKLRQEIVEGKKNLAEAKKRLGLSEKNYHTAQNELQRLRFLQRAGIAFTLAQDLEEGEPCPVCGSKNHPQLAVSAEIVPDDEEISRQETVVKRREIERNSAVKAATSIEGKISAQEAELEKFKDILEISEAQKIFDEAKKSADELKKLRERIPNGETKTKEKAAELEGAQKILERTSKSADNLRGVVEEKKRQIPREYSDAPEKISGALIAAQKSHKELDDAWKKSEEIFHRLSNEKSAQVGKVQSAETAKNSAAEKISDKVKPNIPALEKNFNDAQKFYEDAVKKSATLENILDRLQKIFGKLENLREKISAADKNFQVWKKLSDAANGRTTFQRYYLSAVFKSVIEEANARLEKMSGGRYRLQEGKNSLSRKISEGLDFEIFDTYTGKARDVNTLSGGESFLASLSLALGLAAVVQNTAGGTKLDTIFIDEGFGSLDSETLDVAINTLMDLQKTGRLVGIISHVDELKQRIPIRLEVTKNQSGSDARFVC